MKSVKYSDSNSSSNLEMQSNIQLIPDDNHPDYVHGAVSRGIKDFTEYQSVPIYPQVPHKYPLTPLGVSSTVSGLYTHVLSTSIEKRRVSISVRVDVDRFFPQNCISITVSSLFPRVTAHAIAEVTSDISQDSDNREIAATITYCRGDESLIKGTKILFRANKSGGSPKIYTITLIKEGLDPKEYTYNLKFQSKYFDPIEFEIDRVENAGAPLTSYDTGSHPNHPADLVLETISLTSVYQRAGFDVTMSPNTTVIPTTDAGANGTWSNSEMHNAMVTYWSRFANRPQWALWVLFAEQHDIGHSLGGIMFDDIGSNHRQGTAIFTNSFIQDVPSGDINPDAWRQRSLFWCTVHEMGHTFNLAHSWQKALVVPGGNPWIPLVDEPEARSFMNYPYRVKGGEAKFFSDFHFRFTDDELFFMRHAPREFVKMGGSDWFVNHGFEEPSELAQVGDWVLKIRPNREMNTYSFLELVNMELKLTNSSSRTVVIDGHLLDEGGHITVFVQREGAQVRKWRPMFRHCYEETDKVLKSGESIYSSHMIGTSTDGWLISEPGFYKVQAAIEIGNEIVVSNILRLYVKMPAAIEDINIAPDYFSEDVARALVFGGAPALTSATKTLETLIEVSTKNPASYHAKLALMNPKLRDYKLLDVGADQTSFKIHSTPADIDEASTVLKSALLDSPDKAADTLGHIDYFNTLDNLSNAMFHKGDDVGAKLVTEKSIDIMKKRGIMTPIVQAAKRKFAKIK